MSKESRTTVTKSHRGPYCPHDQIEVGVNRRIVKCLVCTAELDPVACLLKISGQQSTQRSRDQREQQFFEEVVQLVKDGGTLAIRPSGVVARLDVRGERQQSTSRTFDSFTPAFVESSLAAIYSVRQRGRRSALELGPRRTEEQAG